MKAKHGYAGAVLLVLLGVAPLDAQMPISPSPFLQIPDPDALPPGLPPTGAPVGAPPAPLPATGQPQGSPFAPVSPTGPPYGSPMPPTGPQYGSPFAPFPPGAQPLGSPNPTMPAAMDPGGPLSMPVLPANPAACPSSPLAPGSCWPVGAHGPIGSEIYIQTGPNLVLSDTGFARSLNTGYETGIAGRSLFFNRDGTRDWNILVDVNFIHNNGIPTNIYANNSPVTIRNLDRTTVGLGLGRDWFLLGSGNVGAATGTNLRAGVDGGARWGTSHVDLNVLNIPDGYDRIQHIYGEGFAGFRLNLEVPMGGWTFLTGARAEYAYSDLHVLPFHQDTALHNLNLLFTMGIRY